MLKQRKPSLGIRISRGILIAQSITAGLGGAMISIFWLIFFLGAVFSIFSVHEWQYLLGLLIVSIIGSLFFCIAGFFWLLKIKLTRISDKWGLIVLSTQIVLTAIGIVASIFTANVAPPPNGTDGPFADGGEGYIALAGWFYLVSGVCVIVLFVWEYLWTSLRSRRL